MVVVMVVVVVIVVDAESCKAGRLKIEGRGVYMYAGRCSRPGNLHFFSGPTKVEKRNADVKHTCT